MYQTARKSADIMNVKNAATEAFAEERVLTQKEIEEIIRQGQK